MWTAVLLLLQLLPAGSAREAQQLHSLGQHYQYGSKRDCLDSGAPPPSPAACLDPSSPTERAAAAATPCSYCAMQCYLAARNETRGATLPSFDYVGMLNDLGLLLAAHDDYSGAAAVFGEAVELAPLALRPLVNWAGVASSLQRYEEAEGLLSRALRILEGRTDLPLLKAQTVLSAAAGEDDPSLRALHAKVLYNYGVLQQHRGAILKADENYVAALALDPEGMFLAQG